MAGYTRQSAADIVAGAVVKAAPVDAEFQQVLAAFNASTGHKHDGTSAEGAYVPLISDTDNYNKVVVDATNNRVSFYVEVGGTAVEQARIQDGAFVPVTDDDIDLGASGAEFKDLYIDGIGYIDSVVITGGTIDGTVIGATTPAAADFTTMDASGNSTVGGTFCATGNTTFGGTLGVTGVSTFSGTVCAPNICGTGTATLATVDINAGNIDNTTIGATTAAAGSFTTVSTTGQGTFATVDINGGTIDGATIGGTTPGLITGTTITANTGFTGDLTGDVTGAVTGNVTGNLTGNVTGDVTGDITGDVTGNVTGDVTGNLTGDVTGNVEGNVTGDLTGDVTSTGTSTFCDINMSGTAGIDMGSAKITSLATPTADADASTKGYVDQQITDLIGGAPGALDTLNELAAAINDDAAFYSSVTTCLGTKLNTSGGTMSGDITLGANKATSTATPATDDTLTRKGYVDTQDALKLSLTGGTMSGAIAMGTSKITGLGDPTAAQDAATKTYTDTQRDTRLACSGGTVTGTIDMGANKITTTYTPTNAADLTTKTYVDGILGSSTDAATSASCAAASATAAATSASNSAGSATSAANSATCAANTYDAFDDRYLGSKSSDPSTDNDGDPLLTGAIYWNNSSNSLRIYDGSAWGAAAFTLGDALTCIQEDSTPVLGGNLDANTNCITNATTICATNLCGSLVGNVTGDVTGTVSSLSNHDTDDLAEGTNQYFTTARVDSHLSGGTGVTYSSGAISIGQSVGTSDNVCFGSVCVTGNPTQACQLATKEYVDTIAAAGIHYHDPVRVEAPSALTANYNNGSSGVGATLTNSGTQAALVIDGVTLSTSDRVLVYNQTNAAHNGVYTVTDTGSASTNWVLTRATDADSYGASDQDALGEGDAFFVKEGDTGAGELYVMNTSGTITFGTTNISFTVVAETAVYGAGSGLTLDGTTFNIGAGTGVTVNANDIAIGQAVGTSDTVTFARVCAPVTGDVTGNATSATCASKWTTARTLCICGDAVGSASVDGSGNVNLSVAVQDDSHNHTISNVDGLATCLSGKAASAGSSSQDFSAQNLSVTCASASSNFCAGNCLGASNRVVVGQGSGSVALTMNDGHGNSNVTFNHAGGIPDQDGNAARIEVNTDSTTCGCMIFAVGTNVQSGTGCTLTDTFRINEGYTHTIGCSCATICARSPIICAPTCMQSPIVCASTAVCATCFKGDGAGLTGVGATTNVITTNTTATKSNHYYLNAAGLTLTLPSSPSVGDEVRISEVAGATTSIIARNSSNIMGSAEDLTVDSAYAVIYLRYVDATIGWAFS